MLPKVVVIGLSPREIKWFWSENLSELYVINCEENETGNFKLFISRSDFCCELRKEYENKIGIYMFPFSGLWEDSNKRSKLIKLLPLI